ncbi:NADPH:quinone reductase [Sulfitobacter guttiformis]|uniref:NADPH:quinone reductase-like Zn-dependent oxidoreductase n=1 Tax=Sulfitobacter guttiformis TaxID=74349 RepID=A0A420DRR6_9RHOB|nr:NADPH:quinone reductase [Sulfitobacter guttiformis]KIN74348.1 Oxidoreductase, zinc-binding dehydrogenase family [Sulfitobacter guttiformis KCTC 32187]RKE96945.1 NADPH:quinone reductase-like Zn-dependent oxidoreductase [Sulfitobacter guttiformis]
MRAAHYTATGPAAEVLELIHLPDPVPDTGEVLVRVHASGINPADVKRRAGWNGMQMAHPSVIPHCDGAGVIVSVGEGVSHGRIGERVWLWNAQGGYGEAGRAFGTAAELIALPAAQAVRLPDTLDFAAGACLGVPGLTAWLLVLADGPVAGKTLLVQGAAGAVGHMAVQIALFCGADVIAVVGSDAGAAHVRTLADIPVINRHTEDVASCVRTLTNGAGANRIIEVDLAANLDTDIACLRAHGMIASYSCSSNPEPILPYYKLADLGAMIRFVQGFRLTQDQRSSANAVLATLAEAGALVPHIGAKFPLSDIARAHERVEGGALGQVVLTLGTSDEGACNE